MILKGNEVVLPLKPSSFATTYGFNWEFQQIFKNDGSITPRKFPSKNWAFGGNCLASFNFSCCTASHHEPEYLMPRGESENHQCYYGAQDINVYTHHQVVYSYMNTCCPTWHWADTFTPNPNGMHIYNITDRFYSSQPSNVGFSAFQQKQNLYICDKPANHSAIYLEAAIGYFIILNRTYDPSDYGIGWLCGRYDYVQSSLNNGTITTYVQPFPYYSNPSSSIISSYYPAESKDIGTATVNGTTYHVIAIKSRLDNTIGNIHEVWNGDSDIGGPLGWVSQPYLYGSIDYFMHVGAEYYGNGYSP